MYNANSPIWYIASYADVSDSMFVVKMHTDTCGCLCGILLCKHLQCVMAYPAMSNSHCVITITLTCKQIIKCT